jgi:ABC-type polysaccharide/polyol phosphate transport system ATPase subunit
MSRVLLTDISVEIPLRGVSRLSSSDPRLAGNSAYPVVSALRGLSLEAVAGDRIGVLGSNGSGKTTLLRVIAGIIPVVSGSVQVVGNVYGIFNIAEGFRMALTGRENSRLRYHLLGEPGGSLSAFIEDAREFADLGDFFDLPVSSYSPGMLSRLMFALSTVKPAEILLLDEWIGVADRAFQEKAADRLRQLVNDNDIVFIASHDRAIIGEMTNKVITLDQGKLLSIADTQQPL